MSAATNAAHRIIRVRSMSGAACRYTCACGETVDAHPDLRDEAFAFHLATVTAEATS